MQFYRFDGEKIWILAMGLIWFWFDLVLVSYGFDGLVGFDFVFHMGLINLISNWWLLFSFWFHCFDGFAGFQEHEQSCYGKEYEDMFFQKNNEKKKKLNLLFYFIFKKIISLEFYFIVFLMWFLKE